MATRREAGYRNLGYEVIDTGDLFSRETANFVRERGWVLRLGISEAGLQLAILAGAAPCGANQASRGQATTGNVSGRHFQKFFM